jgi:hypothetical protein
VKRREKAMSKKKDEQSAQTGYNINDRNLTDVQFEIIVAMLNENPKLAERLKVYLK